MTITAPRACSFRHYQSGDEARILELQRLATGLRSPIEEWRWKAKRHTSCSPHTTIAHHPKDGIVAHTSLLDIPCNIMGKQVRAAQATDTLVHPQYTQTKVGETTRALCHTHFTQTQPSVLLNFLTPSRHHEQPTGQAWKHVTRLKEYRLRVGIRQLAHNLFKHQPTAALPDYIYRIKHRMVGHLQQQWYQAKLSTSLTFHVSQTVPAAYKQLWNHVRYQTTCSIWKDAPYLAWRYDQHPGQSFQYVYLKENEEIVALAVIGQRNQHTQCILELMVRNQDRGMAQHLLQRIALLASQEQFEELLFVGTDASFFDVVFANWHTTTKHDLQLSLKISEGMPNQQMCMQANNWQITLGDIGLF